VAVANGIFLSYPLPVGWLYVAGSGRYTYICTVNNCQYCVETPYSTRSLQAERSTEIAGACLDSFTRSHPPGDRLIKPEGEKAGVRVKMGECLQGIAVNQNKLSQYKARCAGPLSDTRNNAHKQTQRCLIRGNPFWHGQSSVTPFPTGFHLKYRLTTASQPCQNLRRRGGIKYGRSR
jgi:hypothetical protein